MDNTQGTRDSFGKSCEASHCEGTRGSGGATFCGAASPMHMQEDFLAAMTILGVASGSGTLGAQRNGEGEWQWRRVRHPKPIPRGVLLLVLMMLVLMMLLLVMCCCVLHFAPLRVARSVSRFVIYALRVACFT